MNLLDFFREKNLSQAEMARRLKISQSQLWHFTHGIRPVPAKYCKEIEKITNGRVSVKDLRPNDWQQIWG